MSSASSTPGIGIGAIVGLGAGVGVAAALFLSTRSVGGRGASSAARSADGGKSSSAHAPSGQEHTAGGAGGGGGGGSASTVAKGAHVASLRDEQLSRCSLFFGEEGMAALADARVVVVGLGGVGSHAANLIARSGVGHIRLIDFDNVTLSSLNRHATATRADVGVPKVEALKSALAAAVPFCEVEAVPRLYEASASEELLLGPGGRHPNFVMDCIDDAPTKTALLHYCSTHGIPVVSAMSAGAKADPTRLHIADISDAVKDPLARKVRRIMTTKYGHVLNVPVVYSTEKAELSLSALDEEQVDAPQEFGALENFRLRVLPVLGTTPAIFGNALASYVLCKLGKYPLKPVPLDRMSPKVVNKMYQKLLTRERAVFGYKGKHTFVQEDLEYVMRYVFYLKSPLSGAGLLGGKTLILTRWDNGKPAAVNNVVCVTPAEAKKLLEHGHDAFDRDAVARTNEMIRQVDEWSFLQGEDGGAGLRLPMPLPFSSGAAIGAALGLFAGYGAAKALHRA